MVCVWWGWGGWYRRQGMALGFGHEIVVRGRREAERQHKIRARQSLHAVQDVVVRPARALSTPRRPRSRGGGLVGWVGLGWGWAGY
jgi:hypothetical protein